MSLAADTFAYVADLVRRESAIVLEPGKEYLVESRLLPVARAGGHASVEDYVRALRLRPTREALNDVVEALTTNETFWFRDMEPFEVLRSVVVPEVLRSAASRRKITVWSGACSSGQEAYTIAMIMSELVVPLGWQVEILATDISQQMLDRVEAGTYSQLEVNRGLPAPMLVKYFRKVGTRWQVSDELRAMVKVRPLNLAQPFGPLPTFDIVFLRNVLIYFDTDTKRRILQQVRHVTAPGGALFLGAAETTIGLDDVWERTPMGRFTLNRKPTAGSLAQASSLAS
jgi:chemotaxis protein methyltransferase CheR